jgi:O-antigen ligase
MIGLTAGGVVVALLLGRQGRRFALLQAGLAVAGLALHTLFFRLLSREGTFESVIGRPATTTGRTPAWERAWEMFLESPVFGRGPQSFAWEGIRFGHPHSTPLQILAEWGLAGATLIAVGVTVGGVVILRLRRSGHFRLAREGWLIALVYGSVAAGTHSLVSGVAVFPLSHLGGLIVLALWFRLAGVPRGPVARAPGAVVGVTLALLVAAGFLFPDAVLDFFGPLSLDLDSLETQGFGRPRFWRDGV